jgi:hypothetical protein
MVHRLEIPLIHIFRIQSQSLTGDCFILLMYPTFSDDAYSLSFQLTNIICVGILPFSGNTPPLIVA